MRTPSLPPYSVHRFALWSFLLGSGHTGTKQGKQCRQTSASGSQASPFVGQLGVDTVTDPCLPGACTSFLLPPPSLQPLLWRPAGVRTQTGLRRCLKTSEERSKPPEDHLAAPATRSPSLASFWGTGSRDAARIGRPLHHRHTRRPSSPLSCPQVRALTEMPAIVSLQKASGPFTSTPCPLEQSPGVLVFNRDVPKCHRGIQFPVLCHWLCYLLSGHLCLNRWIEVSGHLARGSLCDGAYGRLLQRLIRGRRLEHGDWNFPGVVKWVSGDILSENAHSVSSPGSTRPPVPQLRMSTPPALRPSPAHTLPEASAGEEEERAGISPQPQPALAWGPSPGRSVRPGSSTLPVCRQRGRPPSPAAQAPPFPSPESWCL